MAAHTAIIDTHVHLLQPSRFHYSWLPESSPLYRDMRFADLHATMTKHGVVGGVLIEATNTSEEIPWLLDQAARRRGGWGVIGWIDLHDEKSIALAETYIRQPLFKGIRMNWSRLRTIGVAGERILDVLAAHGRVLEILVDDGQLEHLAAFVHYHSSLIVILDHLGGGFANVEPRGWFALFWECAGLPNCIMKLSGFAQAAGSYAGFAKVRDICGKAQGFCRRKQLIFGSDTPLHAPLSYGETLDLVQRAVAHWDLWDDADRAALFHDTAVRVYRLEQS